MPPEMTWLNGSCTVTLLHLALISQVLVCYLCFWALKSCDHLKTTYSQLQHSCLFFLKLLFNGLLSTFVSVSSTVRNSSDGFYVISALFQHPFNFNFFFFFKVYESSREWFQNIASDNLPCRTSAMQMQRNDECKKKEFQSLILFSDPFNAVGTVEAASCRSHYVSLLLEASIPVLNPQTSTSDSYEHGWVGLVSVSL